MTGQELGSSIGHCERLLQKQPDNVLVLNTLAWAYQQVKDKRALETAERAYKLKPDSAAVADTLGWMLVEQGSFQEAAGRNQFPARAKRPKSLRKLRV